MPSLFSGAYFISFAAQPGLLDKASLPAAISQSCLFSYFMMRADAGRATESYQHTASKAEAAKR